MRDNLKKHDFYRRELLRYAKGMTAEGAVIYNR